MSFLVELSISVSQKEIRTYVQMHLSLLIEVSIRFRDWSYTGKLYGHAERTFCSALVS